MTSFHIYLKPLPPFVLFFQIADVKIVKKKENGLEVKILSDDVSAYLPTMHLSDHVTSCRLWWHWLKGEEILHNVVCLHDKGGHIVSFLTPVKSSIQSFSGFGA